MASTVSFSQSLGYVSFNDITYCMYTQCDETHDRYISMGYI